MGRICECHSYGKCNGDVFVVVFRLFSRLLHGWVANCLKSRIPSLEGSLIPLYSLGTSD
jgi:hypothetical protein